jgi:putative FmdB family regulatory protein
VPIYEYVCSNGHIFERYMANSERKDEPLSEPCPECSAPVIKRLVSRVGISFRGNGFHCNDYKKEKA